jgi:glutathione S-transferase
VEGKEYLAGGAFSIADISVGTMFVNFDHAGEKLDAKRWPKLSAYVARIHARPSFKAMLDEERPFIQRFRAA